MDAKLDKWNWRAHLRSAAEVAAMTDEELEEAVRDVRFAAEDSGLPKVLNFLYRSGRGYDVSGLEVKESMVVLFGRGVYGAWGIILGEWIDTVYDAYDRAWEAARQEEDERKRLKRRDLESRLTGQ